MPVDFVIDEELRTVFSTAKGEISLEEMLDHWCRLAEAPDFDPAMDQLFDMSRVTGPLPPTENIRKLAALKPIFGPTSRRAFVNRPGGGYGVTRMFQALRGPEAERIGVFTDRAEAVRWLGLPEELAASEPVESSAQRSSGKPERPA